MVENERLCAMEPHLGLRRFCLEQYENTLKSMEKLILWKYFRSLIVYDCCIVVLRPRLTSKVMSGRSVNLTTLFLGRLRPPKRLTSTSCTYFRQ